MLLAVRLEGRKLHVRQLGHVVDLIGAIHSCLDKFREWEELMILTVQYSSLAASVDYGDAAAGRRAARTRSVSGWS